MKYGTNHALALTLTLVTVVVPASVVYAHKVIEASGQVKLKRGSSDYRPIILGESLKQGDILLPEQGATIKVLCDNSTIWRVPSGKPSGLNQGCPFRQVLIYRPSKLKPRLGGNNFQLPYILSPRMTYLLNDRPAFRWNGVSGATRYRLGLRGPGGLEWQTEVNSTELVYPDSAPPLERNVKYLLTVEADNDSSSLEDGGANLGFTLLEEDQVKKIRDKAATIAALSDLTEEEKALALAELYSNQYLNADAIATLEALVKKGSQTAYVYLRLGDLYAETGLNLLAKDRYSKARELLSSQNESSLQQVEAKLSQLRLNAQKAPSIDQIVTPSD